MALLPAVGSSEGADAFSEICKTRQIRGARKESPSSGPPVHVQGILVQHCAFPTDSELREESTPMPVTFVFAPADHVVVAVQQMLHMNHAMPLLHTQAAPQPMQQIPQRPSTSAARRRRRKRAKKRNATGGADDPGYNFESTSLRLDDFSRPVEQGCDPQLLIGRVWAMSLDKKGCRLVQVALEKANHELATTLASELCGHILEAVQHPHANYVVQKVIQQLSINSCTFIVKEIQGFAAIVAKNYIGCRTLCRLLEFCSANPWVGYLMDELVPELHVLCCHSFAQYVVQAVLEHGEERHRHVIAETLLADVMTFAQQKRSSFLVEKVLSTCSDEDQGAMIHALNFKRLLELAKTHYGRHVAKTVLQDPRWYAAWGFKDFELLIEPWRPELAKHFFGILFLKDMTKS